jgi:hypothetical protein
MADNKKELTNLGAALAALNKVRLEGNECEHCEDGTWYQIRNVEEVTAISTPSTGAQVMKGLKNYSGPSITLACCGCGEESDYEYATSKEV